MPWLPRSGAECYFDQSEQIVRNATSRHENRARRSRPEGQKPSDGPPDARRQSAKSQEEGRRRRRKPDGPSPVGPARTTGASWRYVGPVALAAAFVALAAWSWRRWPDLLVDFGHELYVPWQLSAGRVLYRDLALLYGPFSQYANAGLFGVFGASLTTLIVANLVVLACISGLLYGLLARACDRLTATAAGLVFLGLFGFSQYVSTGNYNFVCPYSHEATHGVLFAIVTVFLLGRFASAPTGRLAALAGLSFGLSLLTRSEVALAAAAAAVVGLGLALLRDDSGRGRHLAWLLAFLAGATAPAAGAFLLFLTSLPASDAAAAVAGAWMPLVKSEVTRNAFFQEVLGFDVPMTNIRMAMAASGVLLGVLLLLAGVDLLLYRLRIYGKGAAVVAAIVAVAAARSLPEVFRWQELGRVLTVTSLAASLSVVGYWFRERDPARRRSCVGLAAFSVLAFVLLLKMVLNPRIYHYGFYLAMPATLVLVVAVLWGIPSILRSRWGGGLVFRAASGALVVSAVIFYLGRSNEFYRAKDYVIGRGGDAILEYRPKVEPRAEGVRRALERIEALVPPDGTFVALPEGVMLNYLTRRANPTPYTTFMPTELAVFGETPILSSLKAAAPDFIVLVHKDTSEFGVGYFGNDPRYGAEIMQWIRAMYVPIEVIQHQPLVSPRFGILIAKRRDSIKPPGVGTGG